MNNVKPLLVKNRATEEFNPNALIDGLLHRLQLKNDAALSRALELPPSIVSKLRRSRTELTAGLILRIHDVTGMPVNEIRKLAGIAVPDFGAQAA